MKNCFLFFHDYIFQKAICTEYFDGEDKMFYESKTDLFYVCKKCGRLKVRNVKGDATFMNHLNKKPLE